MDREARHYRNLYLITLNTVDEAIAEVRRLAKACQRLDSQLQAARRDCRDYPHDDA